MFRAFTCLVDQHDWRYVVLAGLVCFAASIVAVNIFHRALATRTLARLIWIGIAGGAIGFGIGLLISLRCSPMIRASLPDMTSR